MPQLSSNPHFRRALLFAGVAAVPVIDLAGEASRRTWAAPVSIATIVTMVLLVGIALFVVDALARRFVSVSPDVVTAAVAWAALGLFHVGSVRATLNRGGLVRPWHWALVTMLVLGIGVWIGIRFDTAGRFIRTFVAILVVSQIVLLTLDGGLTSEPDPIPAAASAADVGGPPSIWVIVVDSHASPKVLRDIHSIDLAGPIERLERSGFRVWDDARANYSQTLVSIPSLLSGEVWPVDALPGSYPQMLAGVHGDTSLTAALQDRGFRIRMAPTNWSRSECGRVVDECREPSRYNEHWNFLIRSTPLSDLLPTLFPHPWPPGGIETLRQIDEFGAADRHVTFIHSLASHPPAVLDADCRTVPLPDGDLQSQLECTHDVLFAGVSSIDLASDVVIIAADHGYLTGSLDIDPAQWRDETVRDRFSAFVAVSTPAGCEDTMPERLSTAQILPFVLNCYDADLPVPAHRFVKVNQLGGGIEGIEVDWDGWSVFTP